MSGFTSLPKNKRCYSILSIVIALFCFFVSAFPSSQTSFINSASAEEKTHIGKLQQLIVESLVTESIHANLQNPEFTETMLGKQLADKFPGIKPVTADQLYAAYEQNELKADHLYKNKWVLLTGTIKKISSKSDQPVVTFDVDKLVGWINATFANSNEVLEKLYELEKGQKATLICQGAGKRFEVEVKDCELFDTFAENWTRHLVEHFFQAMEGKGDKAENAEFVALALRVQKALGEEGAEQCLKGLDQCRKAVQVAMQHLPAKIPEEFTELGYSVEMLKKP